MPRDIDGNEVRYILLLTWVNVLVYRGQRSAIPRKPILISYRGQEIAPQHPAHQSSESRANS